MARGDERVSLPVAPRPRPGASMTTRHRASVLKRLAAAMGVAARRAVQIAQAQTVLARRVRGGV